jgi:protein-disulfide isomerase
MALALIAVAAALTVAAFYMLMSGTGGAELQGLENCGSSGPALAVVYAEGQERLADLVASLLEHSLGQQVSGLQVCKALDKDLSLGLRAYPALLVRGSGFPPDIMRLVLNETVVEGFRPIAYEVASAFVTQVSGLQPGLPQPLYTASGTAVVVQGRLPPAKVNSTELNNERILRLISALYAANITEVKIVDEPPEGLNARQYPALYVESSYNLEEGTLNVNRFSEGKYAVDDIGFGEMLMSLGVIEAYEVKVDEPLFPERYPALGSGSVHVIVYEDYACPYCARLYRDTMPMLVELASQGKIMLHFADLIVHNNDVVRGLHTLALCRFLSTGDAQEYYTLSRRIYSYVDELYSRISSGNISSQAQFYSELDKLLSQLGEELGAGDCSDAEALMSRSEEIASHYGFGGTPTVVVWVDGSDRALVVAGYRGPDFFTKLLSSLKGG